MWSRRMQGQEVETGAHNGIELLVDKEHGLRANDGSQEGIDLLLLLRVQVLSNSSFPVRIKR